jgi:hypothetical protein
VVNDAAAAGHTDIRMISTVRDEALKAKCAFEVVEQPRLLKPGCQPCPFHPRDGEKGSELRKHGGSPVDAPPPDLGDPMLRSRVALHGVQDAVDV